LVPAFASGSKQISLIVVAAASSRVLPLSFSLKFDERRGDWRAAFRLLFSKGFPAAQIVL
jgi:hypothetical protein